ncbi:nucleotidyltransferase family protein [Thermus thermamylovorans]|uniref:Nucleotidyltransferase domain-containing protein n=1 Tax=Thermus thermamylovorans TaxID=2509362 RepID=A0A4Q9BA67_9DEIN|nr:nucleotidyltransferase domain-containing protein [Thermus thermamylovorans]TBH21923.1 nucleotidyltransferase domain-containing protein [Thermus thermamylovorans]
MATSLERDRQAVLTALAPYLQGRGVKLILYGSHARGKAGRGSDLDLALLSPTPLGEILPLLREALEEGPVLRRVELVDLGEVDPAFRERVLREGIVWAEF